MALEILQTSFSHGRPSITRLNSDTSWLVSIPSSDEDGSKCSFFNILIDPWFQGKQVVIAEWFLAQQHLHESRISSIAALEQLLREQKRHSIKDAEPASYIDAVIISHESADHCHRPTLQQLQSTVPIFASPSAVKEISSWQYFETVIDVSQGAQAESNWRTANIHPLPQWLGIRHLSQAPFFDSLYGGIILFFTKSCDHERAEAIIYAPHGIRSSSITCLKLAEPKVELAALIFPWAEASIAGLAATYGWTEGEKIVLETTPRYWVNTHDGEKRSSGILSWLLGRRSRVEARPLAWPGRARGVSNVRDTILKTISEGETLAL